MEYKKYEYPSFNIYTVKTNRFKTVQMEIIFSDEVKKDELLAKTFLADLMTDCSNAYKSRKEVVKKLEELYQATFYGLTNKVGNLVMSSFVLSFLNPLYVKEKNYLNEIISLPFEMIMNPFINAEEFDIKNFNIVKNRLKDEILSVNEDISRVSMKNALSNLDNNSPSSYGVLGTIEDLESISPKKLYNVYQKLINNKCDIFVVGNIDMDEVANIIYKSFKNPVIKTKEFNMYVDNESVSKLRQINETSKFLETNLVQVYNVKGLTKKEQTTIMHFYNYLLGGGGLNTKLYQLLREKNSLCYGIKSMYLKYDNLLLIQTSINKSDVKKAEKLIKQAFTEMKKGKFTEEELEFAKENFIFSLNLALDNPAGILNNYVFNIFDNLPLIDERIKMIKNVTKEEIVNVANKIKPNIFYVLEGEENGNN
ncbi:MAG: insulinase family protein [Firmicutes bacterium]|nr:insulinase family protein [Bacillota bacterium]